MAVGQALEDAGAIFAGVGLHHFHIHILAHRI
jgi:hypothetical protein